MFCHLILHISHVRGVLKRGEKREKCALQYVKHESLHKYTNYFQAPDDEYRK
jgi:hypothetical protein